MNALLSSSLSLEYGKHKDDSTQVGGAADTREPSRIIMPYTTMILFYTMRMRTYLSWFGIGRDGFLYISPVPSVCNRQYTIFVVYHFLSNSNHDTSVLQQWTSQESGKALEVLLVEY